jgi:DNA-binding NtrC family response regulator
MSGILIIDDDPDFSGFLREALESHGHKVEYVDNVGTGLEALTNCDFGLILLDNRMPGISGLEALGEFRTREIDIPVVMMTSQGTSEIEIQAWIQGVFDYVDKPLDIEEIEELVDRLEPTIRRAEEFKRRPRIQIPGAEQVEVVGERRLLGKSQAMKSVLRLIAQAAPSEVPVLIHGESGTGKELVARAIHDYSPRRDQRFIALNIASLTESLLECQLFGHEANIVQGVDRLRKGYFEDANGGTLFLDEIGEMPVESQSKLLRVVEEQCVYRIGSSTPIPVDVRLVSATNRDLIAETKKGTFREDLYFRLATFPIELPPLRNRSTDLALLGRHFRIRAAQNANRPAPVLHPRTVELLRSHSWPGNVRELRDVLTRAVLKCQGFEIMPEHLGLPAQREESGEIAPNIASAIQREWESDCPNLHESLHDWLDRELIQYAANQCGGNKTEMAKRLGLTTTTVLKLMRRFGIEKPGAG